MPEYIRVRAKGTGHHYSVVASAFDPEIHQELKQDAVNANGDPLPPTMKSSTTSEGGKPGQKAESTKENR